jgi:D-amino-acid dehydrogenase
MKVVVLGAGIVGVSTAYWLARDGHEVEVVDAAEDVAADASAGNAGFIAPNDSFAWASPSAPVDLLRSLFGAPTGLRVRPSLDSAMYGWGLRFLRECTSKRAFGNSVAQMELSQYSVRLQAEVEAEEGIEYSVTRRGAFYLYRDAHKLQKAAQRIPLFEKHGIEQELVTVAAIIEKEPALGAVADKFAGAIYGVSDASGDCRTFTRALADRCRDKYAVRFSLGTRVKGLRSEGDVITSADSSGGPVPADVFVLALGVGSAAVARTVGVRLPVFPFKGYSATFPVLDPDLVPAMPSVEQTSLIAWSRFANGLRMSSTAEMVGYDRSWQPKNFASIVAMALELFPRGIDVERGEFRSCLRPMTPDGPPIIGFTKHSNLLVNTGHGHLGWTMGLGTGLIATDLIGGRLPAVVPTGRWLPRGPFKGGWTP